MLAEPELDKPGLQAMLRETYGLDIAHFTFVPRGLAAYGYIAEGRNGDRVFVKLYDPARIEPTAIVDPTYTLPLIWSLHHDGHFRRLPCPIRARDGAFVTRFERYNLVLLTYLAGRPLDELPDWPDALRDQLARVIGEFHHSTGSIRLDRLRVEQFDTSIVHLLTETLDTLESLPESSSPAHATLRGLLLPQRAELLAGIERLASLAVKARGLGQEMVLCHSDLWAGNLLLGDSGELFILDWDDIRLAPPEQDLFFYVLDATGERFLDAYEQVHQPPLLSADTFGYYLYRRTFDDIIAFAVQLLEDKDDETHTRAALHWLGENLVELRDIEPRIETARAMLERRRAGH